MQELERDFAAQPSAARYMAEAFVPSRPRGPFPPLVARWRGCRIDPRELERFAAITGLPAGDTLSTVVPMTFGFRLHMALLTDRRAPTAIWRTLQVHDRLTQHRAIPRGASFDLETRVAGQQRLAKGAEVALYTALRVEGALHWESVVTFLVRGAHGMPEGTASLAPAPVAPEAPTEEVASWTMTDGGSLRFGAFTGDYNGIHLWDAYARRFGFRRALYHPSRVLATCLARLPPLPEAHQLDLWLKGPVYRLARVSLRAKEDASGTTFALFGQDDPRPSLIAALR